MSLADGLIKRVGQGGVEITLEAELENLRYQERVQMLAYLKTRPDPEAPSTEKKTLKVDAVFMISTKPDKRGLTEVSCKGPDGIFTVWMRDREIAYTEEGW